MPNTSGNDSTTNYGTVAGLSVLRCIPLIFIGIASFVGNALVLLAIYRFKNLQTFSNAYIGSLAITDVLASFAMLFSYTTLLLDGTWVFGDALCKIQGITLVILSSAPMLTLLCFSIYRCYLVTTVSKRLSEVRLGRIVKCSVVFIWLLAVLYSIPLLFNEEPQVKFIPAYYSCLYDFSSSKEYSIFLILFLFVIPLAVMLIAYVRIIRFIKIHNKTITDTKPPSSGVREQSPSDFDLPSSEGSEKDEGDHFTVMELKRKLEEMKNENSTDWKESEGLKENKEKQDDEKTMAQEETIEEEENEVIQMKRVSLSLTSDYVTEKVRSYSLQRIALEEQYDKKQRRFSLNISPTSIMQKLKARAERKKLLRQYRRRISYQARSARIIIATLVLFVICWTPISVDSFFLGIGYTHERPKFFPLITLWLAYTNALCNPFVYALLNNNFKVAFKKILKGVFNRICVCHR